MSTVVCRNQRDDAGGLSDGVPARPSLDEIGEALLVLRAQRGDEPAFEQLVTRYADRLRY